MKNEAILSFIAEITKTAKNNFINGIEEVKIEPSRIYDEKTIPAEVEIKISNWKIWNELLIPMLGRGAKLSIKDSSCDSDTGEITREAIGEYLGVEFCLSVDMDQSEQVDYDKKILGEDDES